MHREQQQKGEKREHNNTTKYKELEKEKVTKQESEKLRKEKGIRKKNRE